MIKRFNEKDAYKSFVKPALFYLILSFTLFYIFEPYLGRLNDEVLISIAFIGLWRYSILFVNYIRAAIYHFKVYPSYRREIEMLAEDKRYPKHLYFVIPSYKEEPWVSAEVFSSLLADVLTLPSKTTLVIATGSDKEDVLIQTVYKSHPNHERVDIILQRQSQGKRIAMGHALRAVARVYNSHEPEEGSLTILMDGDSLVTYGTLKKTLPFFAIRKKLGALTTNEIGYIDSDSSFYKDWFNLKFAQRHILFQSQSLSKRVLTLTGRFSVFRTSAVITEDFISNIEHDIMIDPLYGKFRFLMGDDKSSWYNMMKHGWDMLYLPDVTVYSLESRDGDFFEISQSLPFRWYGNTLRNNARARKLKNQPLFIRYLLYDQLALMWTSLVGIVAAFLLSIFAHFAYLPLYISWAIFVRVFQIGIFSYTGHRVTIRTIPLMLYTQWIGAFVKIKAYFYLADQRWEKGEAEVQTANDDIDPIKYKKAHYLSPIRMYLYVGAFLFFLLTLYTKIFAIPDPEFLASEKEPSNKVLFSTVTDDGKDDAKALNALIASVKDNTIILLPSGVLDIDEPLFIKRSHITLQGDNTVLLSHLKGKIGAVLSVIGSRGEYVGKTLESMDGKVAFKVKTKEPLKQSELLLIEQANDKEYVQGILGAKKWYREFPKLRSEIVEVGSFKNNLLTTLFYSHSLIDAGASIYRIDKVSDVTIKGIKVDSIYKSEPYNYIYKNSEPELMITGINVKYASHVNLENIEIINSGSSPLIYERSYACSGKNIKIDGSINKGKKGNGYLRINKSFHTYLENISVKHIRHIAFQWASAYNVIDGLYSEVDVNFHGGGSHDNEVVNAVFNVDNKKHKWGKVYVTPDTATWAPPDFKTNRVKEKL